MTKHVLSVQEDTPLEEAARIVADNKVGRLPVLELEQVQELIGLAIERLIDIRVC